MLDDVRIAPSVLSADFTCLGDELASISNADDVLYDVMDGHFVPNLSFGPTVLAAAKSACDLPFDVHLMITNPDSMVERYIDAGASIVSFHIEATNHANRVANLIRDHGAMPAIVINPATPVSALDAIIEDVDMVLVMSVNPGFGGQSFIEGTLAKLRKLRALCAEHHVSPLVEVDGGVTTKNAEQIVAAGANVLVAGSAVFNQPDRGRAIDDLRRIGSRGLAKRA